MSIAIVISSVDKAETLIRWCVPLANRRQLPMHILYAIPPEVGGVDPEETMRQWRHVVRACTAAELTVSAVDEITVDAIQQQVAAIDASYLIVQADGALPVTHWRSQLAERLMLHSPCDVLLLDVGDTTDNAYDRVVIPMELGQAKQVIREVLAHQADPRPIVPLLISAEFSGDSTALAHQELKLRLREAGVDSETDVQPAVALADSQAEGIIEAIRPNDLLLLGSNSARLLRELRTNAALRGAFRPGGHIPIGVFCRGSRGSWMSRMGRAIYGHLPELTLADRLALFDRIQGGARLNADYSIMIGLSVVIATLGLLNDSTAVVIGAMLVAPLMTPLVGAGLALAQGNPRLFRRSLMAIVTGIFIGLVLSIFLTWVMPSSGDLPQNVIARGVPNLLDLFIALFSGVAGAYAFSRITVAEALVGVAIAAALVPPLAAVGISIGHEEYLYAGGASLMLLTNLVAIVLGASMVFRVLRVQGTRVLRKSRSWVYRSVVVLVASLLVMSIPLNRYMAHQVAAGQARPATLAVTQELKDAIEERVNQEPGVHLMSISRSGMAQETSILDVTLGAEGLVRQTLFDDLQKIVHDIRRDKSLEMKIWIVASRLHLRDMSEKE